MQLLRGVNWFKALHIPCALPQEVNRGQLHMLAYFGTLSLWIFETSPMSKTSPGPYWSDFIVLYLAISLCDISVSSVPC